MRTAFDGGELCNPPATVRWSIERAPVKRYSGNRECETLYRLCATWARNAVRATETPCLGGFYMLVNAHTVSTAGRRLPKGGRRGGGNHGDKPRTPFRITRRPHGAPLESQITEV